MHAGCQSLDQPTCLLLVVYKVPQELSPGPTLHILHACQVKRTRVRQSFQAVDGEKNPGRWTCLRRLYEDVAEQGRYVETFMVESWGEHLRQHERASVADRQIWERVNSFHLRDGPPPVSHLLYAYPQET